jgi:hypothetical protein
MDLTTTFAAQYAGTVSLRELIAPETLVACARRSTGAKYLVDPRLERRPRLKRASATVQSMFETETGSR